MKRDSRLRLTMYAFGALVGATAFSQARVQLIGRSDILEKASKTSRFTLEQDERAKRGKILSTDGRPLAKDEDTYELRINFKKVPHSDGFFSELALASGIPASEFSTLALGGKTSRAWKRSLGPEQSNAVNAVKRKWRADGLSLGRTGKRAYPLAEGAAGIIGLYRDGVAVSGLEKSQNRALSGADGKTIGLVDRTGAFLPMRLDDGSYQREDGVDIQLTIDFDLQQVAAREIAKAVDQNKADQGVAIVMDPKTGDILAMANWPSFDPTVEGGKGPGMTRVRDLNPATMSQLEPGSTFKILTLGKALDAGKVTEASTINCTGSLTVGRRVIRCDLHGGTRAHGRVGITDAIAKSCNVAAASWARQIGRPEFIGFMEDLGLMERPGVGLPSELPGNFNYGEYGKDIQLATVGFGQSLTTTPLALGAAFSSVANQGKCMFPRLVKQIGEKEFPPEVASQVISPESADVVMRTMEAVIGSDRGTGHSLRIPGYRLAGKTGTAQRIGANRSGYVANFVGYVPAQEPRAMILVMVDHPQGGKYYGASVAGPVFVELAKAVIRRYDLPPTEPIQAKEGR
jgi:cell division protein FtsI/penicillin-binding protein 2